MPTDPPFRSSNEANVLVEGAGNAAAARVSLTTQLNTLGIDTAQALSTLPPTDTDSEAVSRLVALARGNGYCVVFGTAPTGPTFNVVTPASVNLLQSGHDTGHD